MITITGYYAKARCYAVQYRTKKNRRSKENGWLHLTSVRYIKPKEKSAAQTRALMVSYKFKATHDGYETRVVNLTVKQEHSFKCCTYKLPEELKGLKKEFSYDRPCPLKGKPSLKNLHPVAKTKGGKIGAYSLAHPMKNPVHIWHKDYERNRKALAYYEFMQGR